MTVASPEQGEDELFSVGCAKLFLLPPQNISIAYDSYVSSFGVLAWPPAVDQDCI